MDQSTTARQNAIASIVERHSDNHTQRIDFKQTPARQLFGVNVFSDEVMRARLPENVYKALRNTLKKGAPDDPPRPRLGPKGVKEWAIEKGATHYPHWFQPMTGLTAE